MKWVIRYVRSSLSRRLSFWVVVFVAAIFTTAFTLACLREHEGKSRGSYLYHGFYPHVL